MFRDAVQDLASQFYEELRKDPNIGERLQAIVITTLGEWDSNSEKSRKNEECFVLQFDTTPIGFTPPETYKGVPVFIEDGVEYVGLGNRKEVV